MIRMNLRTVYTCFWCLVLTRTANALGEVPDLIQETLARYLSRTSSEDLFRPEFMDLKNKSENKGCDVDSGWTTCDPNSPYRTYDGACNNLAHPAWGTYLDCHLRFLEAYYEGKNGLRRSVISGNPLPLPRDVSQGIFLDQKYPTLDTNFLFTVFGQFVAHDVTNTLLQSAPGSCCSPELIGNSDLCAPILIRPEDPFYSQFNITCFNMIRSAPCPHCNNNGKWQLANIVTAAVDLSVTYGPTTERALSLRTFSSGKLISEATTHGDLLPRPGDKEAKPLFCPKKLKNECFYSGDVRTNQHSTLMSIQTIFLREHNRIADALRELNPHWNDEILYQEARRIVGAEMQNIVYSEYLPALLGPEHMSHYDLYVQSDASHYDEHGVPWGQAEYQSQNIRETTKYDPNIRLGIWNEFASAIFRLHSMVPTNVGMDNYKFRDYYSCPQLLREGKMDRILGGASEVPSEIDDRWFVRDVTNFFLKKREKPYGQDLEAIDIQRGRDHGLPPYVDMLKFLTNGELVVTEFDHLSSIMSASNIERLKEYYADVRDVDLFVGVMMEYHVKDSNLGPSSCAITARQFYDLKFGDRYYYEHGGEATSFTQDQLRSLHQSSLSRILCDNTDILTIPRKSLLLESNKNPLLTCGQIPRVDLVPWKTSPV